MANFISNIDNKLFVTTTGEVGIGSFTTSDTLGYELIIKSADPQLSFQATSGAAEYVLTGSSTDVFSLTRTGTGTILQVASDGLVGILNDVGVGTIAPTSYSNKTLQISGGTSTSAALKITNNSTGHLDANGLDINLTGLNSYIYNRSAGSMELGTTNIPRITIAAGGDTTFAGDITVLGSGSGSQRLSTFETNVMLQQDDGATFQIRDTTAGGSFARAVLKADNILGVVLMSASTSTLVSIKVGGHTNSGVVFSNTSTAFKTKATSLSTQASDSGATLVTKDYVDAVAQDISSIPVTVSAVGGGNKYFLNGVQQSNAVLQPGFIYRFDQSDASNNTHPLRFSSDSGNSTPYTTGVTASGTPGSTGAYTQINTTQATPPNLYYYCTSHLNMGGRATIRIIKTDGNAEFLGNVTIDNGTSSTLIIEKNATGNSKIQFNDAGSQQAYIALDAAEDVNFYAAGANDQIFYAGGVLNETKSGALSTFAGDVIGGTSKTLKSWRRLQTDANDDWGLNNNAGSSVIAISAMGTPSTSTTTFAGNVTAPELRLQAAGTTYLNIGNNTTGSAATDGASIGYFTGQSSLQIVQRENDAMVLSTNSDERMRITSAGAIEIKGSSTTANAQAFITNDNSKLTIGSSVSGSVVKDIQFSSPSPMMYIDGSTGNIGIGTTSPNLGSDGGTAILTLKNTGTNRAILNMSSTTPGTGPYAQEAFYNGGVLKTLVQHVGDGSTDSGYIKWFTTPSGGATTERLRIKSNGETEFKENAEFNKNVFQDIGARGGYIMRPYGADFVNSTASNQTGAIKIVLPTGAVTEDDMIKFTVDVYQYNVNKSFSVDIAGYVYQAAGNNTWINCTAIVNAVSSTENYTVRFGDDGTNHCVYIGEVNKVWQYPQVICRDFMGGFATEIQDYLPEWDITFATSFGPVVVTMPNNFPQAAAPLQGAWTPSVTSSGGGGFPAYSSVGYWQRVGKVVTASFEFTITNLGTASGTVVINNLPVPIAAGNGVKTVVGYGNIAALGQSLSIYHYTALDQIGMNKYDGGFAGTTLATRGTVTYWAEI